MRLTLIPSEEGYAKIQVARKTRGWSVDHPQWLVEACKILEPCVNWDEKEDLFPGISEGTWKRFLSGKYYINANAFRAYCGVLGLNWQDVYDPNAIQRTAKSVHLIQQLQHLNASPQLDPCFIDQGESIPGDQSQFLRDVTIPDGSILGIGEEFIKIWEIRNAGKVYWRNRYLIRVGAAGIGIISAPDQVQIPDTKPGESVQINVAMQAPPVQGTTTSIWKMVDATGKLCFPDKYRYGLYTTIHVI